MKTSKKLLCACLAILLVCIMALPASAASVTGTGEYEYCVYSTYTSCNKFTYSAIMEFQYITAASSGKTYDDYFFRSDVRIFLRDSNDNDVVLGTYPGTSSTRISSNYAEFELPLHHVVAFHYVNGVQNGDSTAYAPLD